MYFWVEIFIYSLSIVFFVFIWAAPKRHL